MNDNNLYLDKIALCGFMGAGKSSIGKSLAELTGKSILDLDEVLFQNEKYPPAYFIRKYGVSHFRLLERSIMVRCLELTPDILVLGGGTLHFSDNLALIAKRYTIVWVDTTFKEIQRRLKMTSGEKRPLWKGGDVRETKALFESRLHVYRKSHHTLSGNKPVDQIVKEIISLFPKLLMDSK